MFELFACKRKKGKFILDCTIHGLSGIPYLSGLYFAKWKSKGSVKTISGITPTASVKEHCVAWNCEFENETYLWVDKNGKIRADQLMFEFKQIVAGTKRSELVGKITIDLSEFICSEKLPKQYLLSASRMNSMAIISIAILPIQEDVSS